MSTMTATETQKDTKNSTDAPGWFVPVGVGVLIWNLLGVMAFFMQAFMPEDQFAKLSEAKQALFNAMPGWYWLAFGVAVFAGSSGGLMLVLRKKWALPLFVLSLLGVLAQQTYMFFLSNTFEVMGKEAMPMPIMIFVVAVALVFYSKTSADKTWLE